MEAPVRLAELLAAVSLAADLGMGQQMGYSARTAYIGSRLADRLGLPSEDAADVFYLGLLVSVGCVGNAHELSEALVVDDIAMARTFTTAGYGSVGEQMSAMVGLVGADVSLPSRVGVLARAMARGKDMARGFARAYCDVGRVFADRLDLRPAIGQALLAITERWDGSGRPDGLHGEAIPTLARLGQVAMLAEGFRAARGPAAALGAVRTQAGHAVDPTMASAFVELAGDTLWAQLEAPSLWTDLLTLERPPQRAVEPSGVDAIATAFADFADLKSPFTVAHSRGVARLAEGAARAVGLGVGEVAAVRRAALLHDLGRVSLPNTILDKPRALNEAERERVRLHSYYTERILSHSAPLADLAALAGAHHERLDGSGYHRASRAPQLPPAARILAAADVCHALGEERPHRAALTLGEVERTLAAEVAAGRLDPDAVASVLAVRRGSTPRRIASSHLTERELEVIALLARGRTNKEIAGELGISEKTVGRHVENTYQKLGVSTRAAAVMQALAKGLLAMD